MNDEVKTNDVVETPSDEEEVTLTDEEKQFSEFADVMESDEDEDELVLGDEEGGEEAKAEETPAAEPEPVPGEPGTPEPVAEEAKPEEPKTPEPVQPPEAEKQPEPVKAEQPEQPKAPSQEELREQKDKFEETLANELYSMSDEENDAMLLEPKKVLPKLAAKVHAEVLTSTIQGILPYIPNIVQSEMQRATTNEGTRKSFYDKWPKLVGHEETVGRVAQMYAQLNPQASSDQTIQDIGLQAMLMLQLPLEEVPATAANVAPTPSPTPAAAPVNPGGAVGMVPQPRPSNNVFTALSEEFLYEDDE